MCKAHTWLCIAQLDYSSLARIATKIFSTFPMKQSLNFKL